MSTLTPTERAHTDRIAALFDAESASLLGYFIRRVDNREDAADCVAETALALWRRAADLPETPERARMWMYGIARRVLATQRRGAIRRSALADRLREEVSASSESPAPELDEVRYAVRLLPAREQELIGLVHWEGFTVTEAAEVIGIRAGTAQMRYSRARNRLRAALDSPRA